MFNCLCKASLRITPLVDYRFSLPVRSKSSRRLYVSFRHRIENYVAIPLRVENYVTISGDLMTRIRFIITSGSSMVLGANIEPLASVDEILRTINFRLYQQCTPYISLNILLSLRLCIPMNEISLWTGLIASAVAAATGRVVIFPSSFVVDNRMSPFQDKRMSL